MFPLPNLHNLRAVALAALVAVASFSHPARAENPPTNPSAENPALALDKVSVYGDRYRPAGLDLPGGRFWLGLSPLPPPVLELTFMGPVVVTASRAPQSPTRLAASAHVLDAAAVTAAPTATLDDVLRAVPGFSLFRRSDSLTTHPTSQGVSLRGVGPSGASRSIVLLDGVPLNDPFGGWVNWAKLPRDAIARVEVVPGGGASAWGNASLGGAIQIFSTLPRVERVVVDQPPTPIAWGARGTAAASLLAGDYGTRSADVVFNRPLGGAIVQLIAEDFLTDGFRVVAPERRGSIDVPAWSRHHSVAGSWRQTLTPTLELTVTARRFEESRGNGTPYQRNGTRESFGSVKLFGQPSDRFTWKLIGYGQDQSFASTFSAVNAARTVETPASDQFAVPASVLGATWSGTWTNAGNEFTSVGVDARAIHGETRENFSYQAGTFTRLRTAGGAQRFAGAFATHERPLIAELRGTAGVRIDRWSDAAGHRSEFDRASGAVLRADSDPSRSGTEVSPSAGIVWRPRPRWRIRSNAQQAFRRPTLNELYRPFRQGVNVVEANPGLRTERSTSAELGFEWTLERAPAPAPRPDPKRTPVIYPAPPQPPLLTLGATWFWTELRDAVSNVTVAHGPGTFPLFGTLPAGGVGRQRLNLDRTRVQGLELTSTLQPIPALKLQASYLYDDATVRRATVAPSLVGRRLAEVPRHSANLGVTWSAPGQFVVTARARWIGRQYDDDENTLTLGAVVIGDVGLSRPLTRHLEVFVNVENVGNARVETARTADGVVNVGTPRLALAGLRGRW